VQGRGVWNLARGNGWSSDGGLGLPARLLRLVRACPRAGGPHCLPPAPALTSLFSNWRVMRRPAPEKGPAIWDAGQFPELPRR
jgi:hypothetical protein